ncbi:MAG: nitrous oxide reductase accessory protein NosL [Haloarculaceae archaeon]
MEGPTTPDRPRGGASPDQDRGGASAIPWDGAISRRTALLATGSAAAVALAGCLGGDGGAAPAPLAVESGWSCDVCGMVLTNHPGPNAEIFYADERPNDHDNPARFCSTWEAFQFDFRRQDEGWEREGFYVTDYSTVDYDVYEEGGDTLITSHDGAEAFADATAVTFVVASGVKGAMGKDLIGFTDSVDAEDFAAEYGGDVVAFADVTRDTISGLGM